MEHAVALLAKRYKIKKPLLAAHAPGTHPETGEPVHQVAVVAEDDANGPRHQILVDDHGNPLEETEPLVAQFDLTKDAATPIRPATGLATSPGAVTIDPTENILTLNPGDTFEETVTVTIPKNPTPPKADVYFLADTTASMGGILSAVRTGATNILNALSGLGADLAFGVGNYKDFPNDPYAFDHQQNPTTSAASVAAAVNTWTPSGGSDGPEGQLFALDRLAQPPGGSIGWRPGAKRIIVWFGDVAGHDPVCAAISGAAADITEASVTAKLVAEGIVVLAISTATPGLDGDPAAGATDYASSCGVPGGNAGQATRIANATGGAFVTGINPGNIVNTIISLVSAAVGSINNVKLTPSTAIAPFIVSIDPAAGYGPLPADQEHVLAFRVRFLGKIPCAAEAQVLSGSLDVVADGAVVASKKVRITVPACAVVYSVKFVCGTQDECECECAPVRPGAYATEINIHNYSSREVKIRKRVVPVVLASAPVGREPRAAEARAEDSITLPPHSATMDDCCRLSELLLGAAQSGPLHIGFLEITASAEIAVTAVYTSTGPEGNGISIDVEQVKGRRQ